MCSSCVLHSNTTYTAKEHFRKIWKLEAASLPPPSESLLVSGLLENVELTPQDQPPSPLPECLPQKQQPESPQAKLRRSHSFKQPKSPGGDAEGGSRALLVLRGLRVRMGMSCGFEAGDLELNKTTSRIQYSGYQATIARAVSDAAQVRVPPGKGWG